MNNSVKEKSRQGKSDLKIMDKSKDNIVLFHPYMPEKAKKSVNETLHTRWIGQGPKVDLFEKNFKNKFTKKRYPLAVGSGTDALHLAYILCGLKKGDEVITTIFTCTATNIPLLYMGIKIKFADIQPNTMNIDPLSVKKLITDKTKAIVCVHYGGLPCDMDELQQIADERGIPIIEDAAQAIGAKYKGKYIGDISDFTIFSFQAIKQITTGDGGMVICNNSDLYKKGQRIRWFGIDRSAKYDGTWDNDICEIGYKYQMTDISAAMGLAGLSDFEFIDKHRKSLLDEYTYNLDGFNDVEIVGRKVKNREHAAWLNTILVKDRFNLQIKLRENNIESNQVHFRNDRYTIFKEFCRNKKFPKMDSIEDRYLVLPLHMEMSLGDVQRICDVIKSGW